MNTMGALETELRPSNVGFNPTAFVVAPTETQQSNIHVSLEQAAAIENAKSIGDPNLAARVNMLLNLAGEYETSPVHAHIPQEQRTSIAQKLRNQAEALRTGVPLMVDINL